MKTQFNDYANDKRLALHAYTLAEQFIRSCEANNSNNPTSDKMDEVRIELYDSCKDGFDYFLVGDVLSQQNNRRDSFIEYVERRAKNELDRNQRAYDWLMVNAVYENATMHILDCFYNCYVIDDREADCWNGFIQWIKSKANGDGTFTFLQHTNNPITVR